MGTPLTEGAVKIDMIIDVLPKKFESKSQFDGDTRASTLGFSDSGSERMTPSFDDEYTPASAVMFTWCDTIIIGFPDAIAFTCSRVCRVCRPLLPRP